jgi:hypothetical protein
MSLISMIRGTGRATSESKQSVNNAEPAEPAGTNSSAWCITPPKLAERAILTDREKLIVQLSPTSRWEA